MYTLYVVQCADGTLYTGITVDVRQRVRQHNELPQGAKYTRSRRPVRLVYVQKCRNRSTASRAEARLKKLDRSAKLRFIAKYARTQATR